MSAAGNMAGPLMIFGSPRSGTTWVGSLFDSHPQTLYLHEPDVIEKEPRLPFVPYGALPADIDRITRDYFERLAHNRSLRSVHTPTLFPKSYRGGIADQARAAIVRALRAVDAVLPAVGRSRNLQVPDFANEGETPYLVMKSVDSIPRLPVFARALPGVKFIYIVRHPCGVVSSKLRGAELGKMGAATLYSDVLALPPARAAGLDKARADAMTNIEKLAWDWLITNEWVYSEVADLPNVYTLVYDRLAANLDPEAASLFDWAGLDRPAQVQAYFDRLRGFDGTGDRYFSLNQNPAKSAAKWRQELSAEAQETVGSIVAGSGVGKLFGY